MPNSAAILSDVNGWARPTERIAGEIVVVEPLTRAHEGGLFTAGQHRDIWRYLTAFPNACENPARFHRWMEEAIAATDEGTQGAWAILERSSGAPIGSTRYLALAARTPRARNRLDLDR